MRVIRVTAVTVLASILAAGPTSPASADGSAGWTIGRLNAGGQARELMLWRISGVVEGFAWSNGFLRVSGLSPHYCQPPRLALTEEQAADILRRQVQSDPGLATEPMGLALMEALKATFPCSATPSPASPLSPRR